MHKYLAVSILSALFASSVPSTAAVQDFRYKVDILQEGMPQPMELEIAPDGRIFFNEIGGALKILKPGNRAPITAATLEVFNGQENGFLGFALDPEFTKNQWIYCFYSPKDFTGQRLSRFTMKGDTMDPASEIILLTVDEQRKECCHHAGSVEFGPDGLLFVSTGDNTNPFGSKGFSPADERPGREPWDAQGSAGNTHDLRGKILRIRPLPSGKYEIPARNLFPKDGSAGRPEIFVMGCRNPWRISVDPKSGFLYWGDVGPDARDASDRGSRGYDELNQARKAGFFGWPYFIGANFPYAKVNFETETVGPLADPAKPVNNSPNNTGLKQLPPAQPAWIYWPYTASPEFPVLGEGGRTACAGPVFHWKPSFEKTDGFPQDLDGQLLFWDWQRPFVKWAKMKSNGDLDSIEPFSSAFAVVSDKVKDSDVKDAFPLRRPVDAVFGTDGCLYMLDYGTTWGANADARLLKISYVRGNLAPVVQVASDVAAGREPLSVTFNSEGTKELEGQTMKYAWRLEKGGPVVSTEPSFKHTFTKLGTYPVELTVTDDAGASASKTLPIIVGNSAPKVAFAEPQDGDFFTPGKPLNYRLTIEDTEDGSSKDATVAASMALKTMVDARWLKNAEDKQRVDPGLALMRQSDCFNCHAVDQKVVGPALTEIAAKYRGQSGALEASIQRVRNGSQGVWGPIPMLAHPQHTSDEIAQMVSWIFTLEPGKGGPQTVRGLAGEITASKDGGVRIGELEASYTDNGRETAGPLTTKTIIRLRGRRAEAEGATQPVGCKVLSGSGSSGNKFLGGIGDGHSAKFPSVPLKDVGSFTVRVASGGIGGDIEFRQGTLDGALLSTIHVDPTGGWDKWVELKSAPIAPVDSRADIVAVFKNPGKSGLMNLDWVQFDAPKK